MNLQPTILKKEPIKERLKELKSKPVLTISELTETVKKLIELVGVK